MALQHFIPVSEKQITCYEQHKHKFISVLSSFGWKFWRVIPINSIHCVSGNACKPRKIWVGQACKQHVVYKWFRILWDQQVYLTAIYLYNYSKVERQFSNVTVQYPFVIGVECIEKTNMFMVMKIIWILTLNLSLEYTTLNSDL